MKSSPNMPTSSASTERARDLAELEDSWADARTDPAAFIRLCLRGPGDQLLADSIVHDRLQEFLTAHPRALVELPRDHGKSTQVCGRILWELGKNPSLRVKIICATDAIAAERSRFLRDNIKRNRWLWWVFPRLLPDEPWTVESFSVLRPDGVIGPSVAALGVGAGSTGTRADLLVCDDVVDVRSLHSRAERDRVADYFHNNLMNLLEPDGRFWGLFTPWHRDDLNARLKRNNAYALFREAVGADFEPVWPEKWSAEALRTRKAEIGAASFSRGYLLLPVAEEETPLRPEWVRFWNAAETPAHQYEQIVLAVDPAVSTATRADRSALVVLGKVSRETTRAFLTSPLAREPGGASPPGLSLTSPLEGEVGGASPPGGGRAARPVTPHPPPACFAATCPSRGEVKTRHPKSTSSPPTPPSSPRPTWSRSSTGSIANGTPWSSSSRPTPLSSGCATC